MFELEYLQEQLKNQILEQEYVESMNAIMESAFDIIEAQNAINETMEMIDEAAKKGFGKINALKAKITNTQNIIKKYKDKALAVNPIGLNYAGYKEFKSDDDIKKKHEKAIKYLNSFNPEKASEDELKNFIRDSGNNVQFNKMSEIFGEGKRQYKIKDIVVAKTSDKNISKSDISAAVKGIESADKMIKNLQDQKNKIDSEYTEYVRTNGLINVKTNTDIDKLRKNAAGHKKALLYIANNLYFITMIQKYTQELDQYKRIVIKAANYNPRNLKESYAIQDYIDSACAFNEYVEFIDEM